MSDQQPPYYAQQRDAPRPPYHAQSQNSHFPPHPSSHNQHQNKNNGREAQEEASVKKAAAETKYFWNLVAKGNLSKQQNANDGSKNILSQESIERNIKSKMREEMSLFGSNAESTLEVPLGDGALSDLVEGEVEVMDPVEVQRAGAGEENIPTLEAFSELQISEKFKVPPFVIDNIQLMKYKVPTPIQKHSIPLGIAGFDLMCCAQTGSGKTFSFLLPVITALFFSTPLPSFASEKSILSGCTSMDSCSGLESPSVIVSLTGECSVVTSPPSSTADSCPNTPEEPVLHRSKTRVDQGVDERGCLPRGIIMAPTRELVSQINIEARKLCYNSNIKSVVIYGGTDVRSQLLELSTGCDLIVATPGRLFDYVERGVVSFCKVEFLVLDEADRMLDMGFEPQIRKIVMGKDMPSKEERQTFLFSATFPDEIKNLAKNFLRNNYIFISAGRVGSTVKNIRQRLVQCSSDQNLKVELLMEMIKEVEGRTLIFVQKKRTASWLNSHLRDLGMKSEEIHGNCTQLQRENSLRNFKNGNNLILIATDVAARGLDVLSVTHVIQFDMPMSSEDFDTYVHRIGRTGRAGKNGVATSFYVPGRGGDGNGGIAAQLMTLMKENAQPIPEWFLGLNENRYGSNSQNRPNRTQQSRPQDRNMGRGYSSQPGGYGNGYGDRSQGSDRGDNGSYGGEGYSNGNSYEYSGGNKSYGNNGYQQPHQQHTQQLSQQLLLHQQQQQDQGHPQYQQQQQQPYIRQQMTQNSPSNQHMPAYASNNSIQSYMLPNRVPPSVGNPVFYNPYVYQMPQGFNPQMNSNYPQAGQGQNQGSRVQGSDMFRMPGQGQGQGQGSQDQQEQRNYQQGGNGNGRGK